jgi:hypothetical protein
MGSPAQVLVEHGEGEVDEKLADLAPGAELQVTLPYYYAAKGCRARFSATVILMGIT